MGNVTGLRQLKIEALIKLANIRSEAEEKIGHLSPTFLSNNLLELDLSKKYHSYRLLVFGIENQLSSVIRIDKLTFSTNRKYFICSRPQVSSYKLQALSTSRSNIVRVIPKDL